MLYWLYTQLQPALSTFLFPQVLLAVGMPVFLVFKLGRGIQRSVYGQQLNATGSNRWLMLLTFLVVILAVTTVFLTVSKGYALSPRRGKQPTGEFQLWLAGGPANTDKNSLLKMGMIDLFITLGICLALREGIRNGGWLREIADRMRRPPVKRGEMGSAQFCSHREFRRFRRSDKEGVTLYGAFWGKHRLRLDAGYGRLCLSGEDAARGILTIGGPGSGKTQSVILPTIADRMFAGHSLIVTDPQGELSIEITKFAKYTGHVVVIHDPTSPTSARYNLVAGIPNYDTAKSLAKVLIPSQDGDNRFWTDSAADLLSACLLQFNNLGEIKAALSDLQALAKKLSGGKEEAAKAAGVFIASALGEGKSANVANNIAATLGTALGSWASSQVCINTSASDFDASILTRERSVIVLTCPEEAQSAYGCYLGATLEKLMTDLNAIAKRNPKGRLKLPVGVILEEFPTLGKLQYLVKVVNLIRKRRISVLVAAQTKGQFELIYGEQGTKALFTGLATQIVFSGGDYDTAEFYSKASGIMTVDSNPDPTRANLRQRPLLYADEIIRPQDGNCTIFARYVEANFGTQIVLNAELTRLYDREDWQQRFAETEDLQPLIVEQPRRVIPITALIEPTSPVLSLPAPAANMPDTLGQPATSYVPDMDVSQSTNKAASGSGKRGFSPDKYKLAMRAKQGNDQ